MMQLLYLLQPNHYLTLPTTKQAGQTLLHHAAACGHAAMVHMLIREYGARVDLADHGGCTPIHVSARAGHADALAALLTHAPALIDRTDTTGQTALHLSMQSVVGFKTTAPLLIQAGAIVTARDKDGVTPIQHACSILALDILAVMVPRAMHQRGVLRVCLGK